MDVDEAQRWAAWTAALDRDTAEGAVWLMWAGYLPQPADEDADPVARWTWLGGLYTDPVWGVAAHFPDLGAAAVALIAGACGAAAQGAACLAQWDAVAELAADRIETTTGMARHVWDSVAELAHDGRNHCAGRRFGAGEAVAAALLALTHAPGDDSAAGTAAVRCAVDAWRVGMVPATVRVQGAA